MAKRTRRVRRIVTKRDEVWNIEGKQVRKVAVRYNNGQFHGATNFIHKP